MKLRYLSLVANHQARKVIDNNIALVLKSYKFSRVFFFFTGNI